MCLNRKTLCAILLVLVLHLLLFLAALQCNVVAAGLLVAFFATLKADAASTTAAHEETSPESVLGASASAKSPEPQLQYLPPTHDTTTALHLPLSTFSPHLHRAQPKQHTLNGTPDSAHGHGADAAVPQRPKATRAYCELSSPDDAVREHVLSARAEEPADEYSDIDASFVQHHPSPPPHQCSSTLQCEAPETSPAIPTPYKAPSAATSASETSGVAASTVLSSPFVSYTLTPHVAWLCVTAAVSFLSVSISLVLWLLCCRYPNQGSSVEPHTLPPWAASVSRQVVLNLFTGIRIRHGAPQRHALACHAVVYGLVGVLSMGHCLCHAVTPRCWPPVHQRDALLRKIAAALVRGFTFVPLSLVWLSVAGIGQGSALGLVTVVAVLTLTLFLPGCVIWWRRPCWIACGTLFLSLSQLQGCCRLPCIQEAVEASPNAATALVGSRWLVVTRLVAHDSTQSATTTWHMMHLIGVWWFGVECACFHTAAYAQHEGQQRIARVRAAAAIRCQFLEGLADREAKLRTDAVNRLRAAHRRLQALRLEREVLVVAPVDMENEQGRGMEAARFAGRDGGVPVAHCSASAQQSGPCGCYQLYSIEAAPVAPHAPFGSHRSRCCGMEDGGSLKNETLCVEEPRSKAASDVAAAFTPWQSPNAFAAQLHVDVITSHPSLVGAYHADASGFSPISHDAFGPLPSLTSPSSTWPAADSSALHHRSLWCSDPDRSTLHLPAVDSTLHHRFESEHGVPRMPSSPSNMHPQTTSPHLLMLACPQRDGASPLSCAAAEKSADETATGRPPIVDTTNKMPPLSPVVDESCAAAVAPAARSAARSSEGSAIESAEAAACVGVVGQREGHLNCKVSPTQRVRRAWRTLQQCLCNALRSYLQARTMCTTETQHPGGADGAAAVFSECDDARAFVLLSGRDTSAAASLPDSAVWRLALAYVAQHWGWVCAFLMLLHFTICSTALSLIPSLASLVYALLPRPWPPTSYWRAQALFSAVAVLLKSVVRLYVMATPLTTSVSLATTQWLSCLVLNLRFTATESSSAGDSLAVSVAVTANTWEAWVDLALSVSVLSVVMMQWAIVFPDHCVLWPTRGRGLAVQQHASTPLFPNSGEDRTRPGCPPAKWPTRCVGHCAAQLRRWNAHRRGAGGDYYAIQLSLDVASVALFCWAYYVIAPADTTPSQDNLVYAVQHNRLPGVFVATTLGLVVVVCVERILYVLQALAAKCVLHVLLACAYHALYLTWRATRTRGSSNTSGGGSIVTTPVALLMAAKLASLWFGVLQLRHGYPLQCRHDLFTGRTDLLHWLGHTLFRAVPFLLELRVLLDWSFSATALKVQHWMLLEDIHHTVYRRLVDMHDLHWTSRHQGRSFPRRVRVYQGMLSFAVILLVLFFPLFWYSTFGPQVHANQVVAWTTQVEVDGFSTVPLYSADATLLTTSFRAVATAPVGSPHPSPSDLLRFAASRDTWQRIQLPSCSNAMWSYTPAALDRILQQLAGGGAAARLVVRNRVTRNRAADTASKILTMTAPYRLPAEASAQLATALKSWKAADANGSFDEESGAAAAIRLPLTSFYAPFILSSGVAAAPMNGEAFGRVTCALRLQRAARFRGVVCIECVSDVNATQQQASPLTYVVASTDVVGAESGGLSLIPNVGIIALYTSFVLVISGYIRNFFAGDAHRVVLLQLANPKPVVELLNDLYLTRSSANNGQAGDLFLEQLLFLELLDLLRSPERLIRVGGRRVDDYGNQEYRESLFEVTHRPFR